MEINEALRRLEDGDLYDYKGYLSEIGQVALDTLEGVSLMVESQEAKKNVVNVIPQECMQILSDAVMEAIRSIDWITLGEKMSERPTGRWIKTPELFKDRICSNCKRQISYEQIGDFCIKCGAKMEA